uniref:MORN repeat-containing protein 5 n=1 Tax=Helicotheca tamesis TaxID=374047 RepID=A0A7S2HAQ4_9STRA|mmetsp:Transcript_16591/g.22740  ORF Transcript_16591/g.22740 Transcript_16591/m.22740 type:complete len:367 (+) Transcript_16591:136-1236(+)
MDQDPTIIKTRLKRGQCPTCGNQLLVNSGAAFLKRWKPVENQFASNGICLLCNYAAAAASASICSRSGGESGGVSVGEIFFSRESHVSDDSAPWLERDATPIIEDGFAAGVGRGTTTVSIDDVVGIPTAEVVTVMRHNHQTPIASRATSIIPGATMSSSSDSEAMPPPAVVSTSSYASVGSSPDNSPLPQRERTHSGATSMVTMSTTSTRSSRRNLQIRDGNGTVVGDYDGDLNSEGERDGHGTMRWTNGHEYDGAWNKNKRQGRGTYRWANGDVYAGCWVDGLREGLGTCRYNKGATYTGEWKGDKMHGRGSYVWPDGQEYVGGFANGLMEGRGHCVFSNGLQFIGEYHAGKKTWMGAPPVPERL